MTDQLTDPQGGGSDWMEAPGGIFSSSLTVVQPISRQLVIPTLENHFGTL